MFTRSILLILATITMAYAIFDHSPKFGGSNQFKPYYLNPYESKYETYGKYDNQHKETHYQPSYHHETYEPKYNNHGSDYYSHYTPSHTPYYGSSYYEQPKHNDYHSSNNYYDKY